MRWLVAHFLWIILIGGVVYGNPEDSTEVTLDTSAVTDSLTHPPAASIVDSILLMNPDVILDTLTEAQRMLVEFETRYRMRQGSRPAKAHIEFSYFDSLQTYFVTPRWDLREDINRSFYHDAGDYFRFDPGFTVIDNQVTPMRKTVQPYGLAGDRLAVFAGRQQLTPFEHVIEPDGMVDLNDIPTALDHHVAILPGPVGWLFGGRPAVATLMTRPEKPESDSPESAFIVDKGPFGYSFARGRYSKRFVSGKRIDMSLGYRNADGIYSAVGDDAYHQQADTYFPLSDKVGLHAEGWLYARSGLLPIRPVSNGQFFDRDRQDRRGRVSLVTHNENHDAKYELAYTHWRQVSSLGGNYVGRLDNTANDVSLSREWVAGRAVARADIDADYFEYYDRHRIRSRHTAGAALSVAWLTQPYRLAVNLRQRYAEEFKFLPSLSAMISRDGSRSFLMLAVGYSERAPSLHELYLRPQTAAVYNSDSLDYGDRGNSLLSTERQLIGSTELELGSLSTNLNLSVTGGYIVDGINWLPQDSGDITVFSPENRNVDFATVTGRACIALADFLRYQGGASYHYLNFESLQNPAYAPEYQTFSGMELHLFWRQKLIDLYAYGEVVYVGPYDGYTQEGLGNQAVFNGKLSFRMGHFRFHWVVQNVLSSVYSARDFYPSTGRYNYYGFTWDFLD